MNNSAAVAHSNPMFNIIIRVLVIYAIVIAMMRLMGKRQIGEMEPFELVITLIIADLATIPMADQTIPIWYGIVPLLVVAVLHYLITALSKKSPIVRDIVSGRPVIVIDPNGIDFEQLKKLEVSCEELLEMLRNNDYFDINDVNYAIIERTGKLTVIPKSASLPTTRKDMQIVKPETDMFYAIVENGKIIKRNFKEMGLNRDCILTDIFHKMLCKQKDLAFCSISEGGDVYAQKFGDTARSFKLKISEKHFTPETLAEKRKTGEAV